MKQPTPEELEIMREKYRRWTERDERLSRIALQSRHERLAAEQTRTDNDNKTGHEGRADGAN